MTDQDKIEKLKAELEHCQQEIQEFSLNASHDLRAPLRHIIRFSEFLSTQYKGKILDQEGSDMLDRIHASSKRLYDLVENLFKFGSASKISFTPERLDLNKLLEEIKMDLQTTFDKVKAKMVYENLPTIVADKIQTRQIFQNLIDNSLKYFREEEAPVIEINCEHQHDQNQYVFVIKDNGIGFDDKYSERIFEPFARLVTQEQYEGTGLGLATVKKIIDQHKGKIEVTSTIGKGSCFVITLPE